MSEANASQASSLIGFLVPETELADQVMALGTALRLHAASSGQKWIWRLAHGSGSDAVSSPLPGSSSRVASSKSITQKRPSLGS